MTAVAMCFRDTAAITARAAQVPAVASWLNGCGSAASNSPGIGITTSNPNLPAFTTPTGPNWSLLDQYAVARTPQVGQVIGGVGITTTGNWPGSGGISGNGSAHSQYIVGVTNPDDVSGAPDPAYPDPTVVGTANLATLAAGWVTA